MNDSKKVLVTGATGFVGSHLVKGLKKSGYEVHSLTRLKFSPEKEKIESSVKEGTIFHELENKESIFNIVSEVKPVSVFHLASYFVAEHKPGDIDALIESNIGFGVRLLEAMDLAGCRSLVTTSSTWEHYNDSEYDPVCLYAATKKAFEDLLKYYINAKGFKSVCLKLFDTYGPLDYRNKLIPKLMKMATEGGQELNMSEGKQKLILTYVDDLVKAYIVALDILNKLNPGEYKTYFLKADEEVTLRELVAKIENIIGNALNVKFGERAYRKREVMQPYQGGQKLPGWSNEVSIEEGLKIIWKTHFSK